MTSKKRLIFSYGILALLLAVLFAANLFWGSVSLTPGAVLAALTGRGQDALSVGIITQLRLPRAVMVVLLGGGALGGGLPAADLFCQPHCRALCHGHFQRGQAGRGTGYGGFSEPWPAHQLPLP